MTDFNEVIGHFSDLRNCLTQGEYLHLGFQPNSSPLKERWRNNGLSADFMADYVTTFFPKSAEDPNSETRQIEIKSAVSFIANELLENAMKYSDPSLKKAISISLILEETRIVIIESNAAKTVQARHYRDFVQKLEQSDPMQMYLEQLEAKALDDSSSGLGFLTMLNDYDAKLAWQFQSSEEQGIITVSTEVSLPI